jgi:hypothetical protein
VKSRGARYGNSNIRDTSVLSADLVARILGAIPAPVSAETAGELLRVCAGAIRRATAEIVPISTARAKRPASKYPGASGTARKASSTVASAIVSRIADRAPPQEPEQATALAPAPIIFEKPASSPPAAPAATSARAGTQTDAEVAIPAVRVVELFKRAAAPDRAPAAPAHAAVMTIGRPQVKRVAPIGWVEQYQARLQAARAYLNRAGFSVSRVDPNAAVPRWVVFGIKQSIGNDELIELAIAKGMPL